MARIRVLAIREREWCREWKDWLQYPYIFSVVENNVPLDHPEKRYYHGFTNSYDLISRKPHIIEKDYGVFDEDDYDTLDAVDVQFCKDFPRQVIKYGEEVIHECGWLATNGDYYPCHSREHISTANYLVRQLWGKSIDGQKELTRLEWISVLQDHIYTAEGKWHVTQRQLDTLYLLYQKAKEAINPLPELPKVEAFEDFFAFEDIMVKTK